MGVAYPLLISATLPLMVNFWLCLASAVVGPALVVVSSDLGRGWGGFGFRRCFLFIDPVQW